MDSTRPDLTQLRRDLLPIVREAGRAILAVYERDFAVEYKDDASPLTQADLASNRVILQRLTALTPDLPVLSEESSSVPYETRKVWNRFWIVDPLDGTKEFVKRNGEFTVNIALIEDGRPVLGVVHAPVLDVTYSGAEGEGAFRQQDDAIERRIATAEPGETITVVASRSHANEATERYLDRLRETHRVDVVSKGSSLKICLVAEGAAHIYPRTGPTSEWDTAAAQAVLEQAGGVMLDAESGEPLPYNKENILNAHFVAAYARDVPLPHGTT